MGSTRPAAPPAEPPWSACFGGAVVCSHTRLSGSSDASGALCSASGCSSATGCSAELLEAAVSKPAGALTKPLGLAGCAAAAAPAAGAQAAAPPSLGAPPTGVVLAGGCGESGWGAAGLREGKNSAGGDNSLHGVKRWLVVAAACVAQTFSRSSGRLGNA